MGALIFTADSGTDQLTSAGHGLATGDPVAGVVSGGGTLAAPLVEATPYWAIRVDANTIKLATSSANALTNVPINLTTNGTGTQYLLVGLPFGRPHTYAPGQVVFSDDLNAMFDSISGAKHPVLRRNIPLTLSWIDTTNTWAPNGTGLRSTAVAGTSVGASYIDCPFDVGDKIIGLEVWRRSDGTAGNKASSLTLATAGGAAIIATVSTDTILTGATTRALLIVPASSGVGHVMAAGEVLRFSFAAQTNTGYIIDGANLVVMRP